MIYSTIQARVAEYLDRTDLTTKIQNWINDTRQDLSLKYDFNYLYTEATCPTVSGTVRYALPTDYLGHLDMMIGEKKLVRVMPREFDEIVKDEEATDTTSVGTDYLFTIGATTPGEPDYYIDRGMEFDLYPTPDAAYTLTLRYYAMPVDFALDADEDYMSRFHPEAVIFGAALRGAIFLDDKDKMGIYTATYKATIKEMIDKEKDKKKTDLKVRMKTINDFSLSQIKRIMKVTNG